MNKKYDEVVKMPCDKLAQTMSDMTYCYEETKVPKSHYKKILEETIAEDLDEIMTSKLLDVYLKTIKQIIDDSPKLFLKAMICLDKKINPLFMRPNEVQALEEVVSEYEENSKKFKGFLNEELLNLYDEVAKNGLLTDDEEIIAVGVGYSFALINKSMLLGIELKDSGTLVKIDHKVYTLYIGKTFVDSQKIDNVFDQLGQEKEMKLSDFQA